MICCFTSPFFPVYSSVRSLMTKALTVIYFLSCLAGLIVSRHWPGAGEIGKGKGDQVSRGKICGHTTEQTDATSRKFSPHRATQRRTPTSLAYVSLRGSPR